MGDEDRDAAELVQDPAVQRALAALGSRLPDDPCPRCMEAPIAPNSTYGFCQPCTTAQDERIKASKRRSYHRRKGLPTGSYTGRQTATRNDEVVVGEEGFRMLPPAEAASLLGVTRRTVERWIADGTLRSIKIGQRTRRIPSDAIADLLDQAEDQEQP
jgi:excisionase family DNA binding protein